MGMFIWRLPGRLAEVFVVCIGFVAVKSTCFLDDTSLIGFLFINEVSMFVPFDNHAFACVSIGCCE